MWLNPGMINPMARGIRRRGIHVLSLGRVPMSKLSGIQ